MEMFILLLIPQFQDQNVTLKLSIITTLFDDKTGNYRDIPADHVNSLMKQVMLLIRLSTLAWHLSLCFLA